MFPGFSGEGGGAVPLLRFGITVHSKCSHFNSFFSIFVSQTSNCNFSYIQDGILTNKSCSDCSLLSSYDKTMHSVTSP